MKTTRVLQPADLQIAVDALRAGRLVVFPTDTVYGVAALASDEDAIRRLFAAKGRDASVALPVMIAAAAGVKAIATPPPAFARLAARFWPGPLTLVLPKRPMLPDLVSGGRPTVGVRIPDHPLALSLLRAVAAPLAVTSANRSGQAPAVTAPAARAQLDGRVDVIIDGGRTPGNQPSTVLDLTTDPPVILRPGPVSAQALARALGRTSLTSPDR